MKIDIVNRQAAEKSALGAAIMAEYALRPILARLSEGDFSQAANRAIFGTLKELVAQSKPIDAMMLYDAVDSNTSVKEAGGLDYVIELCQFLPSATNYEHYINLMLKNSRETRLLEGMRDIARSDDPILPQLERLVERERTNIRPVGNGIKTLEQMMYFSPTSLSQIQQGVFKLGWLS